jgi:hypothetical protein
MTKTLLLDKATWDLTLDGQGNIAVVIGPYGTAQDVASACRLFLGELWYDTTQGLPYFQNILGRPPSRGFLMAKFTEAAFTVPDVDTVQVSLNPVGADRVLTGTITTTDVLGVTLEQRIGETALPWYVNSVFPEEDNPVG